VQNKITEMIDLKQKGGILNILLILLVAAIGVFAIVVYSTRQVGKSKPLEIIPKIDQQVQKLNELGSSDEVPSIEEDLNSTNFNDLDWDIKEVDNSLQSL